MLNNCMLATDCTSFTPLLLCSKVCNVVVVGSQRILDSSNVAKQCVNIEYLSLSLPRTGQTLHPRIVLQAMQFIDVNMYMHVHAC